jgi:hypothetical protein
MWTDWASVLVCPKTGLLHKKAAFGQTLKKRDDEQLFSRLDPRLHSIFSNQYQKSDVIRIVRW